MARDENGKIVPNATKSESSERDCIIPTSIIPTLKQHLDETEGRKLLVVNPNSNKVLSNSALHSGKDRFDQACTKVGLDGMWFHDLRRAYLTRLGRAGATLDELMKAGGHSDVKSVMVYQVSSQQRLHALVEKMA